MVIAQHTFDKKLVKDENITLEKALWKTFFATGDIKDVEEFGLIYFMMTTNMKDYIVGKNEDELRKVFRDTMEGQFDHDLYNESFSNQLESDDVEIHILQQRINWWMLVIERGGLIPNDVYDYTFDELYKLYREAIDLEIKDLIKALKDRQITP